jgi:Polyketide cyclase / dehydrase and lipid transport
VPVFDGLGTFAGSALRPAIALHPTKSGCDGRLDADTGVLRPARGAASVGGVIVVDHSVDIARAPEDVFAYLSDPSKLASWQDVEHIEQLTPGPVTVGTRFREVHRAMGRRRVELTEVVTFEPGRRFEVRVVEGPPVDGRWDFEAIDGGTRLTLTPTVRLPRALGALQPIVAFGTALVFAGFHRRLKRALEAS